MRNFAIKIVLSAAILIVVDVGCGSGFAGEKTLYDFPGLSVGQPTGPLLPRDGALFGTATASIQYCCGEIFELIKSNGAWQEQALASFDGANGDLPYGGVIADANGVLYGTTAYGGSKRAGTVFAVTKSGKGWSLQSIWHFGRDDGKDPFGPVVMDSSGTLYGTTFYGGIHAKGTVFSLARQNRAWKETVLYSFCSRGPRCGAENDGRYPEGGLLIGKDGTIYGTTTQGGTTGQGTVFTLSEAGSRWTETPIWSFGGSGDGVWPTAGLIEDDTGAFYGTTYYGGAYGSGTVFRLSQSGGVWSESVLWSFSGREDGGNPDSSLYLADDGTLYGTARTGGTGGGVVFSLVQSGGQWTEKTLYALDGTDGATPRSALVPDSNGLLYGMASRGGSEGAGTVFQLAPTH